MISSTRSNNTINRNTTLMRIKYSNPKLTEIVKTRTNFRMVFYTSLFLNKVCVRVRLKLFVFGPRKAYYITFRAQHSLFYAHSKHLRNIDIRKFPRVALEMGSEKL